MKAVIILLCITRMTVDTCLPGQGYGSGYGTDTAVMTTADGTQGVGTRTGSASATFIAPVGIGTRMLSSVAVAGSFNSPYGQLDIYTQGLGTGFNPQVLRATNDYFAGVDTDYNIQPRSISVSAYGTFVSSAVQLTATWTSTGSFQVLALSGGTGGLVMNMSYFLPACIPCVIGTYNDMVTVTQCTGCSMGTNCVAAGTATPPPCPAGYYCIVTAQLTICPVGSYCPAGSFSPYPCHAL